MTRWIVFTLGFLVLPIASAIAAPPSPFDGDVDSELRLRLGDPEQERWTTSLNWIDMENEAHRYRAPRVTRVMIDPGHGGRDVGAHAYFPWKGTAIAEKDLSLSLAQEVQDDLDRGAAESGMRLEVRLTREDDRFLSLGRRVEMANDWGADLFVSLHGNSSPFRNARGFEVYFLSEEASDRAAHRLAQRENAVAEKEISVGAASILSDLLKNLHVTESSRFAEVVFSAMARRLDARARGVRQAPFRVLSGTEMPALLVEVAYLTNAGDAKLLATQHFRRRLAGAISSGILEFAAQDQKTPAPRLTVGISDGTFRR